ncbi:hypothetical protein GGR44_002169 [Sphingobium fontiphilum]|uniref:Uncharacterized protein n=1 Tax=Sphingobium fontiphilum TaxID=944425 RepID=A0A7W6DFV1_9SPHN|nr:hypothetical protein [Sphingobium fontiphilum]MBB3982506.1 hypothetical protein [Sphingobium fontiphilum]
MFGNSHFDRVRQLFADQFEPDRDDFLYRKSMKGRAVRVSRAERDAFVADFKKRLRYVTWSIIPLTLILIGALAWLMPDSDGMQAKSATYIGVALILLPFFIGYYWAWNAPARALERRPEEGAARSRDEVRHLMFSRMTYGQLGFAALGGVFLAWKASGDTDITRGWGILWLIFAGALIAVAAVQAFRKWRSERQ